ncbi:unnamed protein product [Lymnaea stagnalis]|uniref:SCP domain-containing protein n=1 Tax=Lymnaea stagnalis TaxID=6523 RepID=A0AAV2HAL9_LYMST
MSTPCLTCIYILLAVSSLLVDSSRRPQQEPGPQINSGSRGDIFQKPRRFVKVRLPENQTRFTAEQKQLILRIHNSYRSLVNPPATDMRELAWDDDLENYAWRHTQACTGAHSSGRMTKKWTSNSQSWEQWYNMGENLYYSYGSMYSLEEAFWMFWNEGKDYDINTMNCTHAKTCGHYQVLTTAKSYRVGCALNRCTKFSVSRYPTPAVFVSCSYNAPFFTNVRPYTAGEACSDCTMRKHGQRFQYCRHNLCIGPQMKFRLQGFDGNTSVVGLGHTSDTVQQTL